MDPLSVIRRLASGRFLDELNEALALTADEVVTTGSPGSVTVKITLHNGAQGDVLVIADTQISRTSPKKAPIGAAFYAVDGGLYQEDIRQPRMEFRDVNREAGEIRVTLSESVEREVK